MLMSRRHIRLPWRCRRIPVLRLAVHHPLRMSVRARHPVAAIDIDDLQRPAVADARLDTRNDKRGEMQDPAPPTSYQQCTRQTGR